MSIFGLVVVFTIAWWIAFQAILPWGVRSQLEGNDVVPGSEPGAPQRPLMLRKALAATIVALLVSAGVYIAIETVPLDAWPSVWSPA